MIESSDRPLRFDVHVHLAGVGTQGSGCWTSPAFTRRPSFVGLRLLLGISDRQLETTIDQDWVAMISSLTAESNLDYAVVLGFDGVYDAAGQLDQSRSQLIVPSAWVFESCERYGNLLPAPSINPYRHDALDLLEEAGARGAVLIKWLPIVQAFDPSSARSRPFLRRAAELGIPLLIHAGTGEVTFKTIDPTVGSLRGLIPALEMGITIVVAHTAAPVHYSRDPSELPLLRELLHRYPNLWVDNSGLANPSRFLHLSRFADDEFIGSRTLHGSDFPIISNAFYYPHRLTLRQMRQVEGEKNRLEREVLLKRAMRFGEETFTRAGGVLSNLDRWVS